MEANGWVERSAKEEDSRVTLIQLTQKGMETAEEMYEKLASNVRTKVFNHFSSAEKKQTKEFMIKLGEILDNLE